MSNPAPSIDLSLVIPAFNEELRLLPTLERLHAHLSARPMSYEILVVDDGSRDKTREVVEAAAARFPNLTLLCQRSNRGKGAAVRRGMLAARGRIRIMWDADCSMPPEELPRLVAPIVAGTAEIAIGSRYAKGAKTVKQPSYRVIWSRLCNKAVQRWLVPRVLDTQCGFKAFTAGAALELVRERDDRRLGLRSRDPRACPPPRLRDRGGRRRVEGRRALARQPVHRLLEGDSRGTDDPPQPRPRRLRVDEDLGAGEDREARIVDVESIPRGQRMCAKEVGEVLPGRTAMTIRRRRRVQVPSRKCKIVDGE